MIATYRIRAGNEYIATLIKRYWRQRPLARRPAVQYTVVSIGTAAAWLFGPWQGADQTVLRLAALGWALITGPGAYFATKALVRQRLRSSLPAGSDTVFSLSDEGISMKGALSHGEAKWQLYSRAVRFPDGIMLLGSRTIMWLPDSMLTDTSRSDATALVEKHTFLRHVP
jgi:hypothetical protein